jgi:hypothetical protein
MTSRKASKFSRGEYTNKDGDRLVVELTIFNDGIVADSYGSTQYCDDFLTEISEMLPNLGFVFDPEMVRSKFYLSQLFVKCSDRLVAISEKMAAFGDRISAMVGQHFGFSAFEFWPEQTQTLKPANFSYQLKTGDPFSSSRRWSQAALPTDKHLELLQELETILS